MMLTPLVWPPGDIWWVRGDDGFGTYTAVDRREKACSLGFAFRSGEVWATDALLLPQLVQDGQQIIPSVENYFARSLTNYSKFLATLGIAPPYQWIAGMEDLQNRCPHAPMGTPAWLFRKQNLCLRDVVTSSGVYTPGDREQESLAPFFKELFDACGTEWPGFEGQHSG